MTSKNDHLHHQQNIHVCTDMPPMAVSVPLKNSHFPVPKVGILERFTCTVQVNSNLVISNSHFFFQIQNHFPCILLSAI